jgi:hypothetical protein
LTPWYHQAPKEENIQNLTEARTSDSDLTVHNLSKSYNSLNSSFPIDKVVEAKIIPSPDVIVRKP